MGRKPSLGVERARAEDHGALCRLFDDSDVPCFCQYFGFSGDHRQWQDRCANDKQANREGLLHDLSRPDFVGFVAREGKNVVGWLRLAPRVQLDKRYQNRLYRNLPCLDPEPAGVLSVACFLVHPQARRLGVATALLERSIEYASSEGASALEAFPRGASDVSDAEQWTGPLALYRSRGFEIVHDFAPYPVLRLSL